MLTEVKRSGSANPQRPWTGEQSTPPFSGHEGTRQNSAYIPALPYSAFGHRARMIPEITCVRPAQQPPIEKTRTVGSVSKKQQEIEHKKQALNLLENENRYLLTKLMNNSTLAKKLDSIKAKMESFPNAEEKVKRKVLKV